MQLQSYVQVFRYYSKSTKLCDKVVTSNSSNKLSFRHACKYACLINIGRSIFLIQKSANNNNIFFLELFNKKTSHAGLSSPDDYVKELQRTDVSAEHLLKSLQSVRVSLTGRPLR